MRGAVLWRAALLLAAFWPVWRWYVDRLRHGSDEPYGLVPLLIAAAIVAARARHSAVAPAGSDTATILWVFAYTGTSGLLPPLFQAVFAMLALAAFASRWLLGQRIDLGLLGLLLLSLPVIASLQFYVGYPLRRVAAEASAWLLRMIGFAVRCDGVALLYRDRELLVDAPCSGVRMLWVTAVVVCGLGAWHRTPPRRLVAAGGLAVLLALFGNALRAATLFQSDVGLLPAIPAGHALAGMLAQALVLLPLTLLFRARTP